MWKKMRAWRGDSLVLADDGSGSIEDGDNSVLLEDSVLVDGGVHTAGGSWWRTASSRTTLRGYFRKRAYPAGYCPDTA